jgi:hypothetical protein
MCTLQRTVLKQLHEQHKMIPEGKCSEWQQMIQSGKNIRQSIHQQAPSNQQHCNKSCQSKEVKDIQNNSKSGAAKSYNDIPSSALHTC